MSSSFHGFRPAAGRLLIEVVDPPKVTSGGIHMPDAPDGVMREETVRAKVLAIGRCWYDEWGGEHSIGLLLGSIVHVRPIVCRKGGGREAPSLGDKLLVVKYEDLFAVEEG